MILRCLRQGATDFLIRPFTTDQMDAAIEKIVRLYPAPHNKSAGGGKVIAVFPSKGACGATTIACNLAYQSKRLGNKKILLADLDPLTGTVSFLFKLKSTYSFLDVLHRLNQLDADLWKQMTQTHQGVDLLLAPDHVVDGLDALVDVTPIIEFAQQTYEMVVLDCCDAYTAWNLSIARCCDELLIVTTNELAALQATQKVLAHLEQNRIDHSKVKIVVNRYDRDVGLNVDVIGTALECEVFQVIPSDYETVQRSLMDGKPIPANSVLGKSLASLADKICGKRERADDDKKSAAGKGLFSMFSKA
jgi:pilus assembly protein CpaE